MIGGVEASPEAYPDSTYYLSSLSDSIDFSAPVKFVVHAYDQVTTKKSIWRKVNIHQSGSGLYGFGYMRESMIGITVKDQKVVTYDYNGSENYFYVCETRRVGKPYQLYYAPVKR